jgi:hypothetical protein
VTHYFSCSGGLGTGLTKNTSRHVTTNLYFCIQWDLWVTWCILVCLGREMATHYFSCPGGTSTDLIKNTLGQHITLNMCF